MQQRSFKKIRWISLSKNLQEKDLTEPVSVISDCVSLDPIKRLLPIIGAISSKVCYDLNEAFIY